MSAPIETRDFCNRAAALPNARLQVCADTRHGLQIGQGPKVAALSHSCLGDLP